MRGLKLPFTEPARSKFVPKRGLYSAASWLGTSARERQFQRRQRLEPVAHKGPIAAVEAAVKSRPLSRLRERHSERPPCRRLSLARSPSGKRAGLVPSNSVAARLVRVRSCSGVPQLCDRSTRTIAATH